MIEIGEAVKHLDPELTEKEPEIPWRAIARMRDQLAHHYFDTDHAIVAEAVTERLSALRAAAPEVVPSGFWVTVAEGPPLLLASCSDRSDAHKVTDHVGSLAVGGNGDGLGVGGDRDGDSRRVGGGRDRSDVAAPGGCVTLTRRSRFPPVPDVRLTIPSGAT